VARVAIEPTLLADMGCLVTPDGARLDADHAAEGAVIRDSRDYDTYLQVDNTSDAPKTVRVRACGADGDERAADRATRDLTLRIGAGETGSVGPFDSAAFVQTDGDLYIDFDDGFTGVVRACQARRAG
jgi:hypothetical protein